MIKIIFFILYAFTAATGRLFAEDIVSLDGNFKIHVSEKVQTLFSLNLRGVSGSLPQKATYSNVLINSLKIRFDFVGLNPDLSRLGELIENRALPDGLNFPGGVKIKKINNYWIISEDLYGEQAQIRLMINKSNQAFLFYVSSLVLSQESIDEYLNSINIEKIEIQIPDFTFIKRFSGIKAPSPKSLDECIQYLQKDVNANYNSFKENPSGYLSVVFMNEYWVWFWNDLNLRLELQSAMGIQKKGERKILPLSVDEISQFFVKKILKKRPNRK